MSTFVTKLDNFEGPLEVLYNLIEKNKIDIYDIEISILIEQFTLHIESLESKYMDELSSFLLMASELLRIKTKMLLPKYEEEIEEDPREDLVQKLLLYKQFKEIAEILENRENKYEKRIFKSEESFVKDIRTKKILPEPDELLEDISLNKLWDIFDKMLLKKESLKDRVRAEYSGLKRDEFTVKEKVDYLLELLKHNEKLDFFTLFDKSHSKAEIVVSFLAILELIKLRKIRVYQKNEFDNIYIERLA